MTKDEYCALSALSTMNSKNVVASGSGKNKTKKDVFVTLLTTLHGVTDRVACGIAAKYPSLAHLMTAYKSSRSKEAAELLLKDLTVPNRPAKIGNAMSKKVYDAFYGNMSASKMMNV